MCVVCVCAECVRYMGCVFVGKLCRVYEVCVPVSGVCVLCLCVCVEYVRCISSVCVRLLLSV